MKKLKTILILSLSAIILLAVSGGMVFAQEIVTADRYMEIVAERYGSIRDYEANVAIRSGNTDMVGSMSFLDPSFMRIDFTRPAEQVISFNGEQLTVYLPEFRVTLNQEVSSRGSAVAGASLASSQGLNLLRRNYIPSFVSGPAPVPLDERTRDMVVKIRLTRRTASENFREIILSIDPETRLIRRMEGRTVADALVTFDFTNIRTNLGIPPARFIYVPPSTANMVNNFLFRDND